MPTGYISGSDMDGLFARLFGMGQNSGEERGPSISARLSDKTNAVLRSAHGKAKTYKHPSIESIHILSALLDDPSITSIFDRTGGDQRQARDALDTFLRSQQTENPDDPKLGRSAHRTLGEAAQFAGMFGSPLIDPEHLFYSIVMHQEARAGNILAQAGITPETIQQTLATANNPTEAQAAKTNTPTLDQFGIDLTQLAREGKLDPVIGRHAEVQQTMEILVRRTKNNPVLIGEPGVGKTAIVEGIAQAIVNDEVPEMLKGRRVVAIDLPGMVAGTRFRGDFEERITKIVREIVANKDQLIVFIDEVHTVLGAGGGGEGGMDAGNILKPRLARGELHLIGATTLKEYRRIEKDAALERRFQPVKVAEPSIADTVLILRGLKKTYEDHHRVEYTDEAITAAVDLSARYITDRFLPDKAIDLIDQAGAKKRLAVGLPVNIEALQQELADLESAKNAAITQEHYEEAAELREQISATQRRMDRAFSQKLTEVEIINDVDVAAVIASLTGIPLTKLTESDRNRLAKLEDELHQRVIGQDAAVTTVAKAVRRSRAGMGNPKQPIGSFLFLGPTGVGKTELAKTLAANLFGSEEALIRVDMSEFGEKHTASRLVGAPPGYVGYDEAGQLTERVRRQPYSVVLLDEIEKAHPDIFNLLLQVLDDGRLTDGQGRTVDFRNTVVIMTSNLGSEILASRSGAMGFVSTGNNGYGSDKEIRARIFSRLRETMRPEFLNRIDEIVLFKKLEQAEIEQIVRLMLLESEARLAAQSIALTVPETVVAWLAEHGYEPEYGARPLQRLIQRRVDDLISDLLISEAATPGSEIVLRIEDDTMQADVVAEDFPITREPAAILN